MLHTNTNSFEQTVWAYHAFSSEYLSHLPTRWLLCRYMSQHIVHLAEYLLL